LRYVAMIGSAESCTSTDMLLDLGGRNSRHAQLQRRYATFRPVRPHPRQRRPPAMIDMTAVTLDQILTALFGARSIFAPSRALRSCFSRRTKIHHDSPPTEGKAR
jgi:hypothetical protein